MAREVERVTGHLPKIRVSSRRRSEPRILELPRAPFGAQLSAEVTEEPVRERGDRTRVEDREGIEQERFDPRLAGGSTERPEAGRRRCATNRGGDECAPCDRQRHDD